MENDATYTDDWNPDNRPTFNVVVPFGGYIVLQMNPEMSKMLADFILSCEDEIETELYALAEFLTDDGRWSRKATGVEFSVDSFNSITNVTMNKEMANFIIEFVQEFEETDVEREIHALCRGLADPYKCYELRIQRRHRKRRHNNGMIHN